MFYRNWTTTVQPACTDPIPYTSFPIPVQGVQYLYYDTCVTGTPIQVPVDITPNPRLASLVPRPKTRAWLALVQ